MNWSVLEISRAKLSKEKWSEVGYRTAGWGKERSLNWTRQKKQNQEEVGYWFRFIATCQLMIDLWINQTSERTSMWIHTKLEGGGRESGGRNHSHSFVSGFLNQGEEYWKKQVYVLQMEVPEYAQSYSHCQLIIDDWFDNMHHSLTILYYEPQKSYLIVDRFPHWGSGIARIYHCLYGETLQ